MFIFREANENDVDVVVYTNKRTKFTGCSAQVGKQNGTQFVTLVGEECYTKRTIQHETLHAIGIFHEHQRNDRDKIIKVDYDCIANEELKVQFDINLRAYYRGLKYNFRSIMHYTKDHFKKYPKAKCYTVTFKPKVC